MIRASLDATVGDEATVQKIERRSQNKGRIQEVRGRQRTVRIGKAPGIRYVQMANMSHLSRRRSVSASGTSEECPLWNPTFYASTFVETRRDEVDTYIAGTATNIEQLGVSAARSSLPIGCRCRRPPMRMRSRAL
jgi:hypothetical protein